MLEQLGYLIALAFSPANMVATFLLLIVLLYWLTVIGGLFDLHSLDGHADGHVDAHVDGHADLAGKGEAGHGGALKAVFGFIGGTDTPAAISISFFSICLWSASLTANTLLGVKSFWIALLLLVPYVLASAFAAKLLTMPFRALFKALGKETESFEEMIGRPCTVTTSQVNAAFGQVRIDTDGAPILLHARTEKGEILGQGEGALVVGYDRKTGIAIVQGS